MDRLGADERCVADLQVPGLQYERTRLRSAEAAVKADYHVGDVRGGANRT
jgi:hypothetical protein